MKPYERKKEKNKLMAGLDEESNVGIHEWDSHGDILAVWQNGTTVGASLLDKAEDVVPSKNKSMSSYFRNQFKLKTHRPQLSPDEWFLSSKRISSIWKAAGSVSMRTVARIVLWVMPM